MHHCHQTVRSFARCQSPLRSPLAELEQAFLALARRSEPLTLPAHLVCDEPDRVAWPVDRIRTLLAHPSTRAELRERTWREVIRRARDLGDPWDLVAVAMAVPVLRRMLSRLARPAHLERAEIEQEALAAIATALHTVHPGAERLDRALFSAADRAVHRLAYAERRRTARETDQGAAHIEAPSTASWVRVPGEAEDELSVLALAVRAGVVNVTEARLIARTRLCGEPMSRLAAERGVSTRQLYRHRAAAEDHLTGHLQRLLMAQ